MDFNWTPASRKAGLFRLGTIFNLHPIRMISVAPFYLLSRAKTPDGLQLMGIGGVLQGAGFRFDGSFLYTDTSLALAPANNLEFGARLLKHGEGRGRRRAYFTKSDE